MPKTEGLKRQTIVCSFQFSSSLYSNGVSMVSQLRGMGESADEIVGHDTLPMKETTWQLI